MGRGGHCLHGALPDRLQAQKICPQLLLQQQVSVQPSTAVSNQGLFSWAVLATPCCPNVQNPCTVGHHEIMDCWYVPHSRRSTGPVIVHVLGMCWLHVMEAGCHVGACTRPSNLCQEQCTSAMLSQHNTVTPHINSINGFWEPGTGFGMRHYQNFNLSCMVTYTCAVQHLAEQPQSLTRQEPHQNMVLHVLCRTSPLAHAETLQDEHTSWTMWVWLSSSINVRGWH